MSRVDGVIDRYKSRLCKAESAIEDAITSICYLSGAKELNEDRKALGQALSRVQETIHGLYRLRGNDAIRDDSSGSGEPPNGKPFIVSMGVDGRLDIEVYAKDAEDAFEKAKYAFSEADLSDIELVDAVPVNAYDRETDTLTDYE